MAGKITELTELTSGNLHNDDLLEVLDVSDTSMAAGGTNKKTLWSSIKATLKTYFDTLYLSVEFPVCLGDETTSATASTSVAKVTCRAPCAMTLTSVRCECVTAPTGSVAILDVHEAGTTIFSTKPQIAISATTSVGGAVPGTLNDTAIADNAVLEFFVDQIGATIAGAGYKITLIGTRA